ncbi:MAG: hypothetical protein A2086_12195 [Spirochaetes bacterium GWD1_27_9]|nr:MAG: hypothetical protein A2Z98_06705 [Spirochaetes bacterium GWB1_27_13]OHD26203.1 MAG: hypothetical protein A2Y34_09635 [Spirochaetes bacterium GWC1_27_15]OHD35741.1 MAG: hypothetical protein A2086_12195 [Spirochaetes bacterium GWD1_27_9]
MNINIIETPKGCISYCKYLDDQVIKTTSDFLEILLTCKTQIIAIDKKTFTDDFFDLKSGLAGEFLQKVSNYRKKLMIIGDFNNLMSNSLKSFIYESNNSGFVLFVENIELGIDLLY